MTSGTSTRPRTADRREGAGGYTLLELLAVMLIVSILAGIGIGFLRGGVNPLDRSAAELRALARAARSRARFRRAWTVLVVRAAGGDEAPRSVVRALGLEPVFEWDFEEGVAGFGPRPEAAGVRFEAGRFGRGAVLPGGREPALRLTGGEARSLAPRDGFLVRLDVAPAGRGLATIVRLGESFALGTDEGGRLSASVTLAGLQGEPGRRLELASPAGLAPGRWHLVEFGYDGRWARLRLDGVPLAERELAGRVYEDRSADFVVSDPSAPFAGAVDEVEYFAYAVFRRFELPEEVTLDGAARLAFDPEGRLAAPAGGSAAWTLHYEGRTEVLRFTGAGVVE